MSRYILYKGVWEAIINERNEMFDGIPRDIEGDDGKATALGIIHRYCRRWTFIDGAIRNSLGSAGTSGSVYFFITICPPQAPDMLSRLKKVTDRLLKRKNIEKYIMVYEQREEKFEQLKGAIGVHMHALIKSKSSYDTIVRAVKNLVGEWIFKVDCKKEAWVAGKVQYLLQDKRQDKIGMCRADTAFRLHFGLQPIYFTGEWPGIERTAQDAVLPVPAGAGGPHGLLDLSQGGRSEDLGFTSPFPSPPRVLRVPLPSFVTDQLLLDD